MKGPEASFKSHFREFKNHLKPVVIFFFFVFGIAFYLSPELIQYTRNVTAVELIAIHPYEIFSTQVKIGFYSGLMMTIPLAAFQLYRFFKPALTDREKKIIALFLPLVLILTLAGGAVGFIFLSEITSEFLRGLAIGTGVSNTWTLSNVLSYVMTLSLAASLIFNIPVFVVLAVKIGLIDVPKLKSYRRHVIIGSVAMAAIISPPDFLSMILLSAPAYVFYEVGLKAAVLV